MRGLKVAAATLVFAVTACGGGDADVEMGEGGLAATDTAMGAGMDMEMDQSEMGMGQTVQLQPLNDSGITGEATVTDRGTQTEVLVRLTGAPANSEHPGHIHSGTCSSVGGVVQPLEPITTDAAGTGSATATVDMAPATIMDGQHIVVYHSGGPPATCAEVPAQTM